MENTSYQDQYAERLLQGFERVRLAQPKARVRQVAAELGVSEYELLRAQPGGIVCRPLDGTLQDRVSALGTLGRVMALSRNESVVHERHGQYEKIRAGQDMGIVLGPDIDLRLFLEHWGPACWVVENGRESLQFFDHAGQAVHKVYKTAETDSTAWNAYLQQFRAQQFTQFTPQPLNKKQPTCTTLGSEVRDQWLAMKDTHELHGILERAQLRRIVALQQIGEDLAQEVPRDTAERMLKRVAEDQISLMCFVSNSGIVQIHSGPIHKVLRTGAWFNVLDPYFNLHLNTEHIDSVWVVTRPSVDGWITSLECFNTEGEQIVQFFGARKPGLPELPAWRALMQSYCSQLLAA